MKPEDPWNNPVVKASWDPSVTHPYPLPPPPDPTYPDPQAWNDWYWRYCRLTQAPPNDLGADGTHQARWNDPVVPRGRSLSRGTHRSPSPAASRATSRRRIPQANSHESMKALCPELPTSTRQSKQSVTHCTLCTLRFTCTTPLPCSSHSESMAVPLSARRSADVC